MVWHCLVNFPCPACPVDCASGVDHSILQADHLLSILHHWRALYPIAHLRNIPARRALPTEPRRTTRGLVPAGARHTPRHLHAHSPSAHSFMPGSTGSCERLSWDNGHRTLVLRLNTTIMYAISGLVESFVRHNTHFYARHTSYKLYLPSHAGRAGRRLHWCFPSCHAAYSLTLLQPYPACYLCATTSYLFHGLQVVCVCSVCHTLGRGCSLNRTFATAHPLPPTLPSSCIAVIICHILIALLLGSAISPTQVWVPFHLGFPTWYDAGDVRYARPHLPTLLIWIRAPFRPCVWRETLAYTLPTIWLRAEWFAVPRHSLPLNHLDSPGTLTVCSPANLPLVARLPCLIWHMDTPTFAFTCLSPLPVLLRGAHDLHNAPGHRLGIPFCHRSRRPMGLVCMLVGIPTPPYANLPLRLSLPPTALGARYRSCPPHSYLRHA